MAKKKASKKVTKKVVKVATLEVDEPVAREPREGVAPYKVRPPAASVVGRRQQGR